MGAGDKGEFCILSEVAEGKESAERKGWGNSWERSGLKIEESATTGRNGSFSELANTGRDVSFCEPKAATVSQLYGVE